MKATIWLKILTWVYEFAARRLAKPESKIHNPVPGYLVYEKAIEALGWMHGECIVRQQNGEDLSKIYVDEMLLRAKRDLKLNRVVQ